MTFWNECGDLKSPTMIVYIQKPFYRERESGPNPIFSIRGNIPHRVFHCLSPHSWYGRKHTNNKDKNDKKCTFSPWRSLPQLFPGHICSWVVKPLNVLLSHVDTYHRQQSHSTSFYSQNKWFSLAEGQLFHRCSWSQPLSSLLGSWSISVLPLFLFSSSPLVTGPLLSIC